MKVISPLKDLDETRRHKSSKFEIMGRVPPRGFYPLDIKQAGGVRRFDSFTALHK
jgi:hypothetical protein